MIIRISFYEYTIRICGSYDWYKELHKARMEYLRLTKVCGSYASFRNLLQLAKLKGLLIAFFIFLFDFRNLTLYHKQSY